MLILCILQPPTPLTTTISAEDVDKIFIEAHVDVCFAMFSECGINLIIQGWFNVNTMSAQYQKDVVAEHMMKLTHHVLYFLPVAKLIGTSAEAVNRLMRTLSNYC